MGLRKRQEGKLAIEQTRDFGLVRSVLTAAAIDTEGLEWAPACYLLAFLGNQAVGVIGVEPMLEAALLRSLFVTESMRRRGIGAQLIGAARRAAHTRGARSICTFSRDSGDYLRRFGFIEIAAERALSTTHGTPLAAYYEAHPAELARQSAWYLDISRDGVIER